MIINNLPAGCITGMAAENRNAGMTEKRIIIQELGEDGLLLPMLVNRALAANDRIKYFFTLLQTAQERAEHPERTLPTMRTERETAGIESEQFDTVVLGALRIDEESYSVPFLPEIISGMMDCMEEMIAPFSAQGSDDAEGFIQRRDALVAVLHEGSDGTISSSLIGRITSGDTKENDSLHLLVMDLHRALNQLQIALSKETIDGAMTYMLGPGDDILVRAFMGGINRTSPLRFDHPGLGTTATRTGTKLLIQNDIGVTDAHVLVVNVEERTVSVVYTDIHMQRLEFFLSLFESWKVQWQDTLSRRGSKQFEKNVYHLSVGIYAAENDADLAAFLTHLGSRIVFLIDWNRARKQLRNFLLNKDSISVLRWAAEKEVGHMGFLRLGGDKLIYSALELAARVPLRYGEPLHQLLGRERSLEYLKWVLKTATTGLSANHPRLLIQDEIKTELLRYFRSAHEGLVEICIDHASLMIEVGTTVRDSLLHVQRSGDVDFVVRSAKRAKEWESRADQLVVQVRTLSRRIEEAEFFFSLINAADDALDELEEACFFTTLLPSIPSSKSVNRKLASMAELAVKAGQEYLKVLIASQGIRKDYSRDEMQEFLTAVNRVISLEQECDEALRQAEKAIIVESTDYKELRVYFELARIIEESTNSLMKAVYIMHDTILEGMNR
jgi:uncharacterized protein Yka (UPF0111/DUF47 family)